QSYALAGARHGPYTRNPGAHTRSGRRQTLCLKTSEPPGSRVNKSRRSEAEPTNFKTRAWNDPAVKALFNLTPYGSGAPTGLWPLASMTFAIRLADQISALPPD